MSSSLSPKRVTAGTGSPNGLRLLSHTEPHAGYLSGITKQLKKPKNVMKSTTVGAQVFPEWAESSGSERCRVSCFWSSVLGSGCKDRLMDTDSLSWKIKRKIPQKIVHFCCLKTQQTCWTLPRHPPKGGQERHPPGNASPQRCGSITSLANPCYFEYEAEHRLVSLVTTKQTRTGNTEII